MLRERLGSPGSERVELYVTDAAVDDPTRDQRIDNLRRRQEEPALDSVASHDDRNRLTEHVPVVQVRQFAAGAVCDPPPVLDDHVADQQPRRFGRTRGIDLADGREAVVAQSGAGITVGAQPGVFDTDPDPGGAGADESDEPSGLHGRQVPRVGFVEGRQHRAGREERRRARVLRLVDLRAHCLEFGRRYSTGRRMGGSGRQLGVDEAPDCRLRQVRHDHSVHEMPDNLLERQAVDDECIRRVAAVDPVRRGVLGRTGGCEQEDRGESERQPDEQQFRRQPARPPGVVPVSVGGVRLRQGLATARSAFHPLDSSVQFRLVFEPEESG